MKRRNLISRMAICLYLVLAVVFVGCKEQEPVKNYKGGIVHYKGENIANGGRFKIEKGGEFLTVYVTKYDYEKYNVGDTIK